MSTLYMVEGLNRTLKHALWFDGKLSKYGRKVKMKSCPKIFEISLT